MTDERAHSEFWATVPSIDDAMAPDNAVYEPSAVRPAVAIAPRRRTVLKSIGVLGGALALNVLSAVRTDVKASATVGTEHLNCAGYDNFSGYDNNTLVCVGFPYSRDNCGSDGWFLRYSGTCFASGPVVICGYNVTAKNAWRWTFSGTPYRCADGFQQWCGGSGYRICSWANP